MTVKPSGLMHPCNVAEMLACTARHVRNLINIGELEAFKIGKRSCRVTRESVIRYLEKNKIDPEKNFEGLQFNGMERNKRNGGP